MALPTRERSAGPGGRFSDQSSEIDVRSTMVELGLPLYWDGKEPVWMAPGQPMLVAGWNVLVDPREPKQMSEGGIALPEESKRREEIVNTVGRIIAMGPTAMQGRTSSGIPLSELAYGVSTPKDALGRWISYARHTGRRYRLAENGKVLHLITTTEIELFLPRPDVIDSAI